MLTHRSGRCKLQLVTASAIAIVSQKPELKSCRVPKRSHKPSAKDNERGSSHDKSTKEEQITFAWKECPRRYAYTDDHYK